MSNITKKLLSALLAALAATAISFIAKSVVPLTPATLQPILTAVLVAVAHYVDAWQGAADAAKKIGPVVLVLLGIGFAANAQGCALFESKLPDVEKCAPTPAELATQVAEILTAGGDYTAALEQLALKDSEAAVICAVETFLGNAKLEATPSNTAAKERGRAYLKSKGVQ